MVRHKTNAHPKGCATIQKEKTMKLFNRQVFKDTAYSTEQFTDSSFNDMLGSAEVLAIHAHSSRISATTAKVSIRIYQSNDNKNWVLHSTLTGNPLGTTSGAVTPPSSSGVVHVKGHRRKDGTYVPPHTRRKPRPRR